MSYFSNLGSSLSKCTFLMLQHFFLPCTYRVNSIFSMVVRINNIHFIDEALFVFATVAMMTEKVSFFCFYDNHYQGKKFFQHNHAIMQLINPNYPRKNDTQEKLLLRHTFYPIAKNPDLSNGAKCSKNVFFGYLLAFVIYLNRFDLFSTSSFS